MAQVRVEIVSMDPGLQINTGEVIKAETIELTSTNTTGTFEITEDTVRGGHIAYIRVTSGQVSWRKDSTNAPTSNDSTPGIIRADVHDAIPVKVYCGDKFQFLWIADAP